MLDFYLELSKYKKQLEPKQLRNMIEKERKDFVDIALSMLKENDRNFEVDDEM